MSEPLLLLENAQIATEQGPLCADYSLRIEGPHALLVGEVEPLLGPLFRRARVLSGSFSLGGRALEQIDPATVGLAPLEPPLPLQRTPLDYVTWSARLAGHDQRTAESLAARLCGEVRLGAWTTRPLGQLHAAYRRLTLLAHALVTEPAFLILEAPLAGLEPQAADYVLQTLEHVSKGRSVLLTAALASPGEVDARQEALFGPAHVIENLYPTS